MLDHPAPPQLLTSLSDFPRASVEASSLLWKLKPIIKNSPKGNGQVVVCISGYGGSDSSMYPLRTFLSRLGYKAVKAEIGLNIESKEDKIKSVDDALLFRAKMVEKLKQRVEQVYQEHQQKVVLIGWSMGGLFALDVSQELPDRVQQVITLGTPFGDPRATSTFKLLRWLNKSDIPIEQQDFASWLGKRKLKHQQVPLTVLYSSKDGIVGQGAALLEEADVVEHKEIESSHIGFALNPKVYQQIANSLARA